MDLISDGIYNLIIFVLAIYVGYHVVWNVTPALHTPLMAVTNAISAIVIVGAMLAAALTVTPLGKAMGTLAALAAVNVFGASGHPSHAGNVQEEGPQRGQGGGQVSHEHEPDHPALSGRLGVLHPGAEGPLPPHHLTPRQPVRHDRHGHRGAHHRGSDLQARQRAGHRRHRLRDRRPADRRQRRHRNGQARRDDQDARTGRLHAQHDRPGRGVHRDCRGGRTAVAGHRRAWATPFRWATAWSCSSVRPSAPSPSPVR